MNREGVVWLLESLQARGFTGNFHSSGEEHYGLSCLFSDRHDDGLDIGPSMTISVDDEGPSFLKCHACRYTGVLVDGMNTLNMSHDGVLSDLVEWVRQHDTKAVVKIGKRAEKVYVPKNYSKDLRELLKAKYPKRLLDFLKEKGSDEKTARGMMCAWVEKKEFSTMKTPMLVENTLVFPILSRASGKLMCVGAQARRIGENRGSKYFTIFPFEGGRHLVGEHLLPMSEMRRLFVLEGPLDVLHFRMIGEEAVGLMGLHLSPSKTQKIRNSGARCVYVTLDPDQDGKGTAEEIAKKLSCETLQARVLKLGTDPRKATKETIEKHLGS